MEIAVHGDRDRELESFRWVSRMIIISFVFYFKKKIDILQGKVFRNKNVNVQSCKKTK